jgi:WW domain-containing oxidoreductase
LTELLLPKLENAPAGARIVNVSSALHLKADTASIEKMNSKKDYGIIQSYARSKLAQVIHAVEMTKRLRRLNSGTKVTINSCHPGTVATNLVRWSFYQNVVKKVCKPLIWFCLKTDQDGAQTPLYLAMAKKVNGVSGKYFR